MDPRVQIARTLDHVRPLSPVWGPPLPRILSVRWPSDKARQGGGLHSLAKVMDNSIVWKIDRFYNDTSGKIESFISGGKGWKP